MKRLRTGELHLLTVNPDRLTRHADDIDQLSYDIYTTRGTWWSQAFENDNVYDEEWTNVAEKKQVGAAQLLLGRQIVLQLRFYSLQVMTMARMISAAQKAKYLAWQVDAVKQVLRTVLDERNIWTILVVVRGSPTGKDISADLLLARQQTFLDLFTQG